MHRYNVPKMTCGHCAGTIEKAVKSVDPEAEVSIDLGAREITIRSRADGTHIAEAIRSAGYDNQPIGG